MIPPFLSNHASFLEYLPTGELLMAWFSGVKEGANNCSIVLSRLNNTQWSKAVLVSRREGFSNQNPVLFFDPTKQTLYLFHSQQPASTEDLGSSEDKAHIWMLQSFDGRGIKWTAPTLLFGKDGSFDRNRIISTLDGSWLYPIYYSVAGDKNQHSAIEISQDHATWKPYSVKDSNYLVQPSVIRPKPGEKHLLAYFRDRRAGNVYFSTSDDEGKVWAAPAKTKLPNNNAAIQATVLQNGHIAIVYNPTHKDRYPLRISISEDGGNTWTYHRDLETGPSTANAIEYSYPTLLQSPDGYIHVSYTYNRETIKYVKFKEDWIHKDEL